MDLLVWLFRACTARFLMRCLPSETAQEGASVNETAPGSMSPSFRALLDTKGALAMTNIEACSTGHIHCNLYKYLAEHASLSPPALRPVLRRMSGRSGTLMSSVMSTKPAVQRTISDLMTWAKSTGMPLLAEVLGLLHA